MTNLETGKKKISIKKNYEFFLLFIFFSSVLILNPFTVLGQGFSDTHIPDISGTWVFSYGEIQEKNSDTGRGHLKKTINSVEEIQSAYYLNLAPLEIQLESKEVPYLNLKTSNIDFSQIRYDWIEDAELNLVILKPRGDINPDALNYVIMERDKLEVLTVYNNVRSGRGSLSLQYNYTYVNEQGDNVDGVLTVYMKQTTRK